MAVHRCRASWPLKLMTNSPTVRISGSASGRVAVVAASPRSLPVLMCSIDGGLVPNPAGDHAGHGRVPTGPIGGQGCRALRLICAMIGQQH
jgi:hypothetical protein